MAKRSKTEKLSPADQCPCDSGKKYGKCCWKKGFEYRRNRKGEISKSVPLSKEALNLLKKVRGKFRVVFGRYPSGKDKLFTDQYMHSLEDMDAAFDKAVAAVGSLKPEIIYASKKTDRIVTRENWKFLTDAEQREWQEAIEEYFSRVESGEKPEDISAENSYRKKKPRSQTEIESQKIFLDNLYAAVCHPGSFLDHAPRRRYDVGPFLQYYFVARTLETLRTIYRIFSEWYTDDVWPLLRLVYESYLRLAFLRASTDAEGFFISIAGTQSGTHEYAKRPNGKTDYGHIVDIETGEKVRNFQIERWQRPFLS